MHKYLFITYMVVVFCSLMVSISYSENTANNSKNTINNHIISSNYEFKNLIYDVFDNKELTKDEFETTSDFNVRIKKNKTNENCIFIGIGTNTYDFKYNADNMTLTYDGYIPINDIDIKINNKNSKFFKLTLFTSKDEGRSQDIRSCRAQEYTTDYCLLIPYNKLYSKYFIGKYTYNLKFSFKCDKNNAKKIKESITKIVFEINPLSYRYENKFGYTNFDFYCKYDKYGRDELTLYKSLFCMLNKIYVIDSSNNYIFAEIELNKKNKK